MSEDFGQTPENLARAITFWKRDRNDIARSILIMSLAQSRLLLPLVEQKEEGSFPEMVQVTFKSKDGRCALLAFTSLAALLEFNQAARPLPKAAPEAALEALEKNFDGMIIDIASEHRIALNLSEIANIAQSQAT